ncbi:MAG: glycoside hydrolase family 15 protein, partial [Thermoplasmata archaeon]|nr:glycoside hydrolase family 15 protein [Thermoplasmata archaeon]
MKVRGERDAFGSPGIEPRWTRGNKDGVGTSYSADSRVWFTLLNGMVTEVYYPLVDHPQVRDLQYMVTDGLTFFHEEKREMRSVVSRLDDHALGFRVTSSAPGQRYTITKEVITSPHLPALLEHTRFQSTGRADRPLRLFTLLAPHLDVGGWGNNAYVLTLADRDVLAAEKNGIALALGASVPFRRLSCGYVGKSDGWSDIAGNLEMDWEFDRALNGNVALTGEIDLERSKEFTLCLAFGRGLPNAVAVLMQALGHRYEDQKQKFVEQWERPFAHAAPLGRRSSDASNLYHSSHAVLLAHEDKTFAGAFIASLSIPWGNARSDRERGGYHLVWTRDLYQVATGLLAAGNREAPLRALIYLAAAQRSDGGFPQNFWLGGEPYWSGLQLDEVAFPIILASRLHQLDALESFDPYPMVKAAAAFLIAHGPAAEQERWEEAAGYSPSTLAATIAALVCAADFARSRGEEEPARFLEEYADFLEEHVDAWTVTRSGELIPGVRRHFVRVHPISLTDPHPDEDPDHGELTLANQPPGGPSNYPAKEIVDAGFLELVRYGIRAPDDPVIVDSLKVVDSLLKVDTPRGPVWRRYNHDGYGQRDDGGPYAGWGRGHAWPLLTGERGHYELAAGRDAQPYAHAMERFASGTGMLTEQVWDA